MNPMRAEAGRIQPALSERSESKGQPDHFTLAKAQGIRPKAQGLVKGRGSGWWQPTGRRRSRLTCDQRRVVRRVDGLARGLELRAADPARSTTRSRCSPSGAVGVLHLREVPRAQPPPGGRFHRQEGAHDAEGLRPIRPGVPPPYGALAYGLTAADCFTEIEENELFWPM